MPSKPLKFLYSKYGHNQQGAGETTQTSSDGGVSGGKTSGAGSLPSLVTKAADPTQDNIAVVNRGWPLHRIGREISKLERINMFFSSSQTPGHTSYAPGHAPEATGSQAHSSLGSANSLVRSCYSSSRRDFNGVNGPSSGFRSRSQEFQSMYRLAMSRSSPENSKNGSIIKGQGNNEGTAAMPMSHSKDSDLPADGVIMYRGGVASSVLPFLDVSQSTNRPGDTVCGERPDGDDGRVMEITMQTRDSVRKSVLPAKGQASHYDLTNQTVPSFLPRPQTSGSGNSFTTVHLRHHHQQDNQPEAHGQSQQRLAVGRLPRCHTRSPVDFDRLDVHHYQHVLNEFSCSSPSICSSVQSDPASSKFSARAHRPSTTRTNSTATAAHRWHETSVPGTTELVTLPGTSTVKPAAVLHRQPSHTTATTTKSPESQWPPRYALIPSWPSYEDIHSFSSCGDHRGILTNLYRKEGRWLRDDRTSLIYRNNHVLMRYPHRQEQIHVVPSHTSTECAMCNLYNHQADPTVCPPNSPMVKCRGDHTGTTQSRASNAHSVMVNRGTPTVVSGPTTNYTPSSSMSKKNSPTPTSSDRATKSQSGWRRHEGGNRDVGAYNTHLSSASTSCHPRNGCMTTTGRRKDSSTYHTHSHTKAAQAHTPSASLSKRVSFSAKGKPEVSFSWDTRHVTCIKANV